ncbi:polysaccharide lyase family 8 super-sandwich domain-containing protein [Paenibacillus oryzisoli]|uniref:SbsA Ig-like domain-containing protein n=1 Tax=Paenibacillus oryzisoli TaxID=1850517 RepID=A0A198AHF9_9BACL|nr:polysaccharide lyase family 8 super-sandwich domain-containing protein [Paenibacillus oryzisoli]OAS20481.1 hypothetical protein A8708_18075 [Paenibacillus oryzisoli]
MKKCIATLMASLLLMTSLPISVLGATTIAISDTFDYPSKTEAAAAWGRANGTTIETDSTMPTNKVARVASPSGDFQIRSGFPHYTPLNASTGKVILSADVKMGANLTGKALGFKVGSSTWYQPLDMFSTGIIKSFNSDIFDSVTSSVYVINNQWHNIQVALDLSNRSTIGARAFLDGRAISSNIPLVDGTLQGVQFINTAGTSYDIDNFKLIRYTPESSIDASFKLNGSSVTSGVSDIPVTGTTLDVAFSDLHMNESTFNASTITITPAAPGAITSIGMDGVYNINFATLQPATTYTVTVSNGVENVFGQKATPKSISFTTVDPPILSSYKLNGAVSTGGNTGLPPIGTYVDIAFSGWDVAESTINNSTITVSPAPPGAVSYSVTDNHLRLDFSELNSATTYTVSVTDGVKSTYGKGATPSSFSFTTSDSTISANYQINGTAAAAVGTIGVPTTGSYVDIVFSEADMNPNTFNSSTMIISPALPGTAAYSCSGDTCRISLSSLEPATTYTLALTNGVKNLLGYKAIPSSLQFTTAGVGNPGGQEVAAVYLHEGFSTYASGMPSGWQSAGGSQMSPYTVDAAHGISFRTEPNTVTKDVNILKSFKTPLTGSVVMEVSVYPDDTSSERVIYAVKDTAGHENIFIMLDKDGKVVTMPNKVQIASYEAKKWTTFHIVAKLESKKFDLYMNGVRILTDYAFPEPAIDNIFSVAFKSWNRGISFYDDIKMYESTAPLTAAQFGTLLSRQSERLTDEQIMHNKIKNAVVMVPRSQNAYVNDVKTVISTNSLLTPISKDGKIYVPAQFLIEKLQVGGSFVASAGSKNYLYNGNSGSFSVEAIAGDGDVLVPAAEFAQIIGKELFTSSQDLIIFSSTAHIFDPVKDAYSLKDLYTLVTYNSIDVSQLTPQIYQLLRDKWKYRLIGDGTHDMNDPDIIAMVEAANDSAQSLWDSLIQGGSERSYLWNDDTKRTDLSKYVTQNYDRVKKMAIAYNLVGSELYMNQALKADILSALDWLNDNRYRKDKPPYDNWWEWEIGTPGTLNDILVLMYDELSAAQIKENTDAIDYYIPKVPDGDAGANLVWRAMAIAVRAIIAQDVDKVIAGRDALMSVFDYTTAGDGFYEDGSFIQHQKHSYTMGYGKSMLLDLSSAMYFFENTLFAISTPSKNNIYDWIREGFEPLMYQGVGMWMASGRELAREPYDDHYIGNRVIRGVVTTSMFAPDSLKPWIQSMAKGWILGDTARNFFASAPFYLVTEAKKIVNDASIPAKAPLVLYKQYAAMDEAVMRRDGYAFAVTMSSSRIGNFESFSGENVRNWYQNEGMTYLYNDLEQYSNDYWPTINPYRLPGITVDNRPKADGEGSGKTTGQDFVGGVEIDGLYGASAMQLDAYNSSLRAKKSWFVFDDEIVSLGTDINSNDNYSVETIVENRQLNGSGTNKLIVNGVEKSSAIPYSENVANTGWAHLQGNASGADIGYYFPQAGNVQFLRETRTGAWSDINKNTSYGSTTQKTKNYMNIWFNHGTQPVNSSYSYVLLPNKTATQTQQYSANPDIEILRNDAQVQAVHENQTRTTAYMFWQPGQEGILHSYNPAAVGLRIKDNKLVVSASDPTQKQQKIVLEINNPLLELVSKDDAMTVTRTASGVRIEIATLGSLGKTYKAEFVME